MEKLVMVLPCEGYQVTEELLKVQSNELPEGARGVHRSIVRHDEQAKTGEIKAFLELDYSTSAHVGDWVVKFRDDSRWQVYSDEVFKKKFIRI